MKTCFATCALVLLFISSLQAKFPEDFSQPLDTLAFGSCNRQDLPQVIWGVITENRPDLWIWLGDNIYGDSADPKILAAKYQEQFYHPNYQRFRETTPIIGTWDDHDYGENNSGKWFPTKKLSAGLALDFMEVPPTDPRRQREGIYGSYTFGPEGKRVKILLIDDRTFADKPGPEADLLGEAQTAWLEKELKESDAQLNIIATGIQFLSEEHKHEKWANFPKAHQRLLDYIREEAIPGVIFLSGDRHMHEISSRQDEGMVYPLLEVTSSGLSHSWKNFSGEPNRHRKGEVFTGLGFGFMRFEWDSVPVKVHLEIRDAKNAVVNSVTMPVWTAAAGKVLAE